MKSKDLQTPQTIWLNGSFLPAGEAAVSPFDRGFLYGDGIFETMRAENGVVLYLREHLERLERSLAELRIDLDLSLDWGDRLGELIIRNGLSCVIAVIKIVVSRGVAPAMGLPASVQPTFIITARKYTPVDPLIYDKGWGLHVFREGFSPPLARFKSLNYLYFSLARQAALDVGADEALLLDPHGNVTETAAGSLLLRTDGKWWTPVSPYQLPGISIAQLIRILEDAGDNVERRPATIEDVFSANTIWVLNSLVGIMPVSRVGGRRVPDIAAQEASRFRSELFRRGASFSAGAV
jgi:branched-chain amino acid aminotransferase/para-aminobenzoate synthetase component 1